MEKSEIAIYALLAGPDKAVEDLGVSHSEIQESLRALPELKTKFIARLRQVLMEKGMKENTKSVSKTYNVPEVLIIEMLRKYLNEEVNLPGNTFYPFDTFDRFTQTFELPAKNWMHVASQTDLPYKQPKKSYSTLEKIEEVRKSFKGEASAGESLINKWKEKISKDLYQSSHVSSFKDKKKDKFFSDVDSVLAEWVKGKNITNEEIKDKCKEVVWFEGCSILVSDEWLSEFKSMHGLA